MDCSACGLCYYVNPAVSVAVFIRNADGNYLWIRRAKEPRRGSVSIPGGFVDFGESAELAAVREIREEVDLAVVDLRFLESQPNLYVFQEITYPVLDLYFTATAVGEPRCAQPEEVAGLEWGPVESIDPKDLAFTSLRAAWETLKRTRIAA